MDHNDNLWVDRRLDELAPPSGWQPDPGAALTRMRQLDRASHRRRLWLAFAASASALVFATILLRAPGGPPAPTLPVHYQAGRADAPVVCEIYSDYQCAPCAAF